MPSSENDFARQIHAAVAAGESLLRIETDDPEDAFGSLEEISKKHGWTYATWDTVNGLVDTSGELVAIIDNNPNAVTGDPGGSRIRLGQALAGLRQLLESRTEGNVDQKPKPVLLVIRNFPIAVAQSPEPLITATEHIGALGDRTHGHIVIVTPPKVKLPDPLDRAFFTITQKLPQVDEVLQLMTERFDTESLDPGKVKDAAKAVLGLTRRQITGAVAESLVRRKGFERDFLWARKIAAINTDGLVSVFEPDETFASIGGNKGACDILQRLLKNKSDDPDLRAKGALCMGPAGTGKTMMAKALGAATSRPTVILNPGALMGGYVGDTERNTRKVFELLDVLSPCVCVIDEVGKVMPKYGGHGDSGVGNRMLGSFLSYMSDTKADVFWMFTANEDALDLHEAFTRAERVDVKFYVGLPSRQVRASIWGIYGRKFGHDQPGSSSARMFSLMSEESEERLQAKLQDMLPEDLIDDDGWTGAEIRACCRMAAITGRTLQEASELISPVAKIGHANIERLRDYAVQIGAIDAETGRVFQAAEPATRRLRKDGSRRSPRRAVSVSD